MFLLVAAIALTSAGTANNEPAETTPEQVKPFTEAELAELAEDAQRDSNTVGALLDKIECRRFTVMRYPVEISERISWGVTVGMAAGARLDSWPSLSPLVIPVVAWEVWARRWECDPPTEAEMASVGLEHLAVDYVVYAHHQVNLSLGADALLSFTGARARPLARFAAGYLADRGRAPLLTLGFAGGPSFGPTGVGWGLSVDARFRFYEASVRFERAPDVSFLVISFGIRDLHRY